MNNPTEADNFQAFIDTELPQAGTNVNATGVAVVDKYVDPPSPNTCVDMARALGDYMEPTPRTNYYALIDSANLDGDPTARTDAANAMESNVRRCVCCNQKFGSDPTA